MSTARKRAVPPAPPPRAHAGRPFKAPGGLTAVLFVRSTPELLDALDALATTRARGESRADVARALLAWAIDRQPRA